MAKATNGKGQSAAKKGVGNGKGQGAAKSAAAKSKPKGQENADAKRGVGNGKGQGAANRSPKATEAHERNAARKQAGTEAETPTPVPQVPENQAVPTNNPEAAVSRPAQEGETFTEAQIDEANRLRTDSAFSGGAKQDLKSGGVEEHNMEIAKEFQTDDDDDDDLDLDDEDEDDDDEDK